MGTIYPRPDHYPPHPEISNKDLYFSVVCYTGEVRILQEKKLIEPIVFSRSSGNPIFGQIFGHPRAANEARNTKMYRGQETDPKRINARYEMNWANSFFKKFRKPCLQTDGRTNGRTDGRTDIGVNPVYPHSTFGGAGGIMMVRLSMHIPVCATRSQWVKHLETHGWVLTTVATDALVLKHQAISIHCAD